MTFENMKFKFDVGDVLNITDGTLAEKYIAIRQKSKDCSNCSLMEVPDKKMDCPLARFCCDTKFVNAIREEK